MLVFFENWALDLGSTGIFPKEPDNKYFSLFGLNISLLHIHTRFLTATEGTQRGRGIKQKGKRTHGHEQRGDCGGGVGGGLRIINGNGKNTIKKKKENDNKMS